MRGNFGSLAHSLEEAESWDDGAYLRSVASINPIAIL